MLPKSHNSGLCLKTISIFVILLTSDNVDGYADWTVGGLGLTIHCRNERAQAVRAANLQEAKLCAKSRVAGLQFGSSSLVSEVETS